MVKLSSVYIIILKVYKSVIINQLNLWVPLMILIIFIYTVQTWDIIKIKRLKEKSYDWVIDIIIYWNKIV